MTRDEVLERAARSVSDAGGEPPSRAARGSMQRRLKELEEAVRALHRKLREQDALLQAAGARRERVGDLGPR